MPKQFLHISFVFKKDPLVAELEPVFNKAMDWVRYSDTCWIVYTSSDAERWYKRLKPKIGARDNVLIVRIDPSERNGYMPKSVWKLFRRPTDQLTD
jgi:hypothetical protein